VWGAIGLLSAAIAAEIGATSVLPMTNGFRVPAWSAVVIAGYAVSIWLLSVVVRQIPISVTYAVWSGVGTAAIAAIGVLFRHEKLDLLSSLAIVLIIGGVVVLNLRSAH
jgi:small multidrug resistance pump